MRVYATKLICRTGMSGFQTFKLVFCIYNKLRLHAEMGHFRVAVCLGFEVSLVLNYCKGNEFDMHKNTQLISIGMVVHQDSLSEMGYFKLGSE